MSVQKTPAALVQVLDSEGKVTNYEVEFNVVYVGEDFDIIRSFTPGRRRESVTAEEFAAIAAASDVTLTAEVKRLSERIAEVLDDKQRVERDLVVVTQRAEAAEAEVEKGNTGARSFLELNEEQANRNTLLEAAITKAAVVLDNVSASVQERDDTIAALRETVTHQDGVVRTQQEQIENLNRLVASLRAQLSTVE